MSMRILIECGCDDVHHSHELGDEDFELWQDNDGVLRSLGIATLPGLGTVLEESDEWMLVSIEASSFLRWLNELAGKRAEIEAAFTSSGKAWRSAHFWSLQSELRELAEHAVKEESGVSASWG